MMRKNEVRTPSKFTAISHFCGNGIMEAQWLVNFLLYQKPHSMIVNPHQYLIKEKTLEYYFQGLSRKVAKLPSKRNSCQHSLSALDAFYFKISATFGFFGTYPYFFGINTIGAFPLCL
jgi:hypothetical protein